MLSDFFDEDPLPGSWEKVTKRMVDPITFACNVNVAYIPRIEDCSYETNNIAIAQPRFGDSLRSANVALPPPPPPQNGKHHTQSTNNDDDRAWIPHDFSPQFQAKKSVQSQDMFADFPGTPTKSNTSKVKQPVKKNLVSATKSGGGASKGGASLGAFFSKSIVEKAVEEADNQSLGSRSMSSRSVSDRSHAERSKSEQSLKSRAHERRALLENMKKGEGMSSIDETDTSEKKGGALGLFLVEQSVEATIKLDDDNRSTMSGSTMSVSLLSNADRSKTERKLMSSASLSHAEPLEEDSSNSPPASPPRRVSLRLKPMKSCILSSSRKGASLKLQFQEETDCCDVPTLSDKYWYEFWDDIWYSEEELSDFRYAAFLEEAGLDASEFM